MDDIESRAADAPLASVVVPAHDEARVIEGNLRSLLSGVAPGTLEVIVVCNGCTDDTARVARSVDGVHVIEIAEPSKARAVEAGGAAATVFPRVHIDADVTMTGADVVALVSRLRDGVHAVGPARVVPLARSPWLVRSYYRVWEQLPEVRRGLFGRGAIALSDEGQRRVDALPPAMGDDLAISEAFTDRERCIVEQAKVVVQPPRTTADLVRRRMRVATGNAQATDLGIRHGSSKTTLPMLARMSVRDPRIGLRMPIFLGIGLLARGRSRRAVRTGDFTTWLRDESSRA